MIDVGSTETKFNKLIKGITIFDDPNPGFSTEMSEEFRNYLANLIARRSDDNEAEAIVIISKLHNEDGAA